MEWIRFLVNECIKNDIQITPIPGPSAISTAISISGFSEKFFFYGFLPEKKQAIVNEFKNFSKIDGSIVFPENLIPIQSERSRSPIPSFGLVFDF